MFAIVKRSFVNRNMSDSDVNKSFGKPLPNMIKFLTNRYHTGREYESKKFRKKWFETAKDLYCKDLVAHYGCVNAVEFSNDGDDLLFSGGDDRRVLMWKVGEAMLEGATPVAMKTTHYSNIFCLAVDCFNGRVFSGSNDDQVILHDYSTGDPYDFYLHESPVFCISLQPGNFNVFTSASENGRVLLYDTRVTMPEEPLCIAQLPHAFHGVMFHPSEPVLLATANAKLGIDIWDVRKPKQILQHCCDEQGMAVRWNSNGTSLLCIRNLLPPLLVNPLKPEEQIEFDADSYYNACTMKSCCFAGENDEYILSGSDDFNVHMWKIPEPWPISKWQSGAHLTLRGHRSIVNQVRYSAHRQLIVSSGVEKVIKLWSPFPMPGSQGTRDEVTESRGRLMCTAAMCRPGRNYLQGSSGTDNVNEDRAMLHFFDSLLRNEFDDASRPFSPTVPTPSKYEIIVRRKKKFLSRTLTESEPFVCSLRKQNNCQDDSRPSGSDVFSLDDLLSPSSSNSSEGANPSSLSPPPGMLVAYNDSSDGSSASSHSTSSSISSSSTDSSSTPPAPRDSVVNLSHSSSGDEVDQIIRTRNNRNYRHRRR